MAIYWSNISPSRIKMESPGAGFAVFNAVSARIPADIAPADSSQLIFFGL